MIDMDALPGLRVARQDARVMIRMLGEGKGQPVWLPGVRMFLSWLDREIRLLEERLRPDTAPLEPPIPAPGDSQ